MASCCATVTGSWACSFAVYSERLIADQVEDFCNLGAWCVLEEYRSHGVRLLRAVLAQRAYTFTDLSPSGNVVPLNHRLGFESLDTTTALLVNRPVGRGRGVRVLSDHDVIERLLGPEDLRIFEDHRHAAAVLHLVVTRGTEHCYVVVRRDRRKGLPVFATLLHISNPGLLRGHLPSLGRHLILHHGLAFSLVEVRLFGRVPAGSYRLQTPRPKMFRSARIPASAIDNLYSELALVAW